MRQQGYVDGLGQVVSASYSNQWAAFIQQTDSIWGRRERQQLTELPDPHNRFVVRNAIEAAQGAREASEAN